MAGNDISKHIDVPSASSSPRGRPVERIFPIRRLVDELSDWSERSGLPSDGSSNESESDSSRPPAVQRRSEYKPPPYPAVPPQDKLKKLPPDESLQRSLSEESTDEEGVPTRRQLSERIQLVPEKSGGEPGVLPGYPIEKHPDLIQRCEDEPIHIPGAIQQYGALVAVRYDENGRLKVRIASENCRAILGHGAEALFSLQTFSDIIPPQQVGDFLARIDHVVAQGHDPGGDTDLDVFELDLVSDFTLPPSNKFWCAIHLSAGSDDLCICEFEQQMELFFPGDPGKRTLPLKPIRTLDNEVVEEERKKSITRMSRPLRVLQIAQGENSSMSRSNQAPMARVSASSVSRLPPAIQKAMGYAEVHAPEQEHRVGFMEMFSAMSQIQTQLAVCEDVQQVLDVVVGLVSEVSGFHRVMVYRFDDAYNGCVVAELVDPRASDDLFRGLHFPASDIPKQARELYKINKIRILFDRDHETARLVGRDDSDFKAPLDLTHSFLRAMSPVHLQYLQNMGVRSSMSISLIVKLWGLVACHSYGENGVRVSLPIRELCRNIGECASINIARLLLNGRLRARGPPPEAIHSHHNPSAFIAASSADLLRIFDADFGILSIQDEGRAIGRLEPYREALALLAHLQKKRLTTILASQNLKQDFPDIKYPPGIKTIAGLLFIPLSMRGTDFIVFFRRAQLREAGNPYEKVIRSGTAEYLEPRSSFKRWTETVVGISRAWTDDRLETAAILGLLYGRFIDVWRQKEMASQRSRMTKLLLRNSSHEVRTPLNAIIKYLELALESPLTENVRDSLETAHRASKSLVYVIDDLLNLTKAEMKEIETPREAFDLRSVVGEVIASFSKEAMRKDLQLTLVMQPGTPQMVKGESSRFRQVLINLAANALQHTQRGEITVEIKPKKTRETSSIISITVHDAGDGMSEHQLDELFQEFEQILDEDLQASNAPTPETELPKKEALGLGLSVVARWVRNMDGKIRVQSEEGKGTRFTLEVLFYHASPEEAASLMSNLDTSPQESMYTVKLSPELLKDESIPSVPRAVVEWMVPLVGRSNIQPSGALAPGVAQSSRRLELRRTHTMSNSLPSASSYHTGLSNTDEIGQSTLSSIDLTQMPPLLVLIAEDNPVNAKVLTRRLERLGHKAVQTVDGQAAHDYFVSATERIDIVLMDIQMPLVDGEQATRMIRATERAGYVGTRGSQGERVPIIAVSASLREDLRYDYVADGFDAWLLKPIDFSRLELLLHGVNDRSTRLRALYTGAPGCWESGGWLLP